jgi:hypothetical protein
MKSKRSHNNLGNVSGSKDDNNHDMMNNKNK